MLQLFLSMGVRSHTIMFLNRIMNNLERDKNMYIYIYVYVHTCTHSAKHTVLGHQPPSATHEFSQA